jgi:hypothetical protein
LEDNVYIDNKIKTSINEKQANEFKIKNDQGHRLMHRYLNIIDDAQLDYKDLKFLVMDMKLV